MTTFTDDCQTPPIRLAAGHKMQTYAWFKAEARQVQGTTHTWSTVWLLGFRGAVSPLLFDKDDACIWPANLRDVKHQYGVNGTIVPGWPSDRTEFWSNDVPAEVADRAVRLEIAHFPDEKPLDIPALGKTAAEIVAVIAMIVAVAA